MRVLNWRRIHGARGLRKATPACLAGGSIAFGGGKAENAELSIHIIQTRDF